MGLQDFSLFGADGTVDLQAIEAATPDLEVAAADLERASTELRSLSTASSWHHSQKPRARRSRARSTDRPGLRGGRWRTCSRALLGGDEPRRYLLAFQNLSAPRGTGGFLGFVERSRLTPAA